MKKLKTLFATVLLATATSTLVYADGPQQQFQQAVAALEKGDYHTAFKLVEPLAKQGVSIAQSFLGTLYDQKQDYQQAVKWYRKAAEQGDAKAQNNLGVMYYQGQGVKRNHKQAKIWTGKACKNGHQQACDILKELK